MPADRLGQRARRLLAEQAFGHGAKHLAPEPRPAAAPPPGWLPPPPLAGADRLGGGGGGGSGTGAAAAGPVTSGAPPPEALHPSWAAKAAAKAQLAAKPAGTKLVFSDDGDAEIASPAAAAPSAAASPAGGRGPGQRAPRAPPTAPAAASPRPAPPAAVPAKVPGLPRHRARHAAEPAKPFVGKPPAARPVAKLHPSWEAKAKLRKQMESLPKPEGTRVVFDDSD